MLLAIPQVLSKEQVRHCRQVMDAAEWIDGRGTAGPQSGSVKHNMQLPEASPAAEQLGGMILEALSRSPLFISAAIPTENISAAVQPLWRRPAFRHPCRRGNPGRPGDPGSHSHGSVGYPVFGGAGGL